MKAKLINVSPRKTWAVVFETDDEVMAELTAFAKDNGLNASQITGLGACRDAVLGFFDWQRKDYRRIPVNEQVEVVSLIGDIVEVDDQPAPHVHVVVSKADGTALGGHLLEAHVRPTLEVIVTEAPDYLRRRHDSASGLPLITI